MKVTPRQLFDEVAASARLTEADKVITARLVADFMALSARQIAGEDVADELAMARAALDNVGIGLESSAARVAFNVFVRIASRVL